MKCVPNIVRSLNPDRRGTEKVVYVVMRPGVPTPPDGAEQKHGRVSALLRGQHGWKM